MHEKQVDINMSSPFQNRKAFLKWKGQLVSGASGKPAP